MNKDIVPSTVDDNNKNVKFWSHKAKILLSLSVFAAIIVILLIIYIVSWFIWKNRPEKEETTTVHGIRVEGNSLVYDLDPDNGGDVHVAQASIKTNSDESKVIYLLPKLPSRSLILKFDTVASLISDKTKMGSASVQLSLTTDAEGALLQSTPRDILESTTNDEVIPVPFVKKIDNTAGIIVTGLLNTPIHHFINVTMTVSTS